MPIERARPSGASAGPSKAGASALPRRAPSPSNAAFASASTGTSTSLTSRIPAPAGAGPASASASASRFGYGGATSGIPAPRAGGLPRPAGAAGSIAGATAAAGSRAKRTSSIAGLGDASGTSKRISTAPPISAIPRPSSRASMASSVAGSDYDANGTGAGDVSSVLALPNTSAVHGTDKLDALLASGPPSVSAEYLLRMTKNEYERRLALKDLELAALEKQLAEGVRKQSKLERAQADITEEWARERAAMELREEQAQTEHEMVIAERDALRKQYRSLSAQRDDLLAQSEETATNLQDELGALRAANAKLEAGRKTLELEAETARKRAQQAEEERNMLEKVLEEESARNLEREEHIRVKEAGSGWGSREEAEIVEKEIKRQALHIAELEATVAKLQSENKYHLDLATNVELLREEKLSLESRLRGAEDLRRNLAQAQADAQVAVEQVAAWTRAIEDTLTAGPDAHLVAQMLETEVAKLPEVPPLPISAPAFQTYLKQLLATSSALAARATTSVQTIDELRSRLAAADDAALESAQERDALSRQLAEEKATSTRASRAEERLKSEVGRYKDILASYEAEQKTVKPEGSAKADFDEAAATRLKALEELVEEQRQQCDGLGNELETARRELAVAQESLALAAVDAGAAAKVKELSHALEASRAEYEQLFKDAEQLSRENDKLLERVGRGEFDTSKEKCWTLTDNPANRHFAVRTATLEALKKENEDLLKRLDELNEKLGQAAAATASGAGEGAVDGASGGGEGAATGLVPRQVVENYKKDIQDLQKSIQAKDKAMLRLKQVFAAKATEFREAVQSLFGYKIRFLENGKIKLSSVYAPSSKGRGTNIIFQSNADNTAQMQLLLGDDEDGGPLRDLLWLKEYWLGEERHNVPCFLAALSKELYEAVTRVEKRGAWRLESGEADVDGEAMQE